MERTSAQVLVVITDAQAFQPPLAYQPGAETVARVVAPAATTRTAFAPTLSSRSRRRRYRRRRRCRRCHRPQRNNGGINEKKRISTVDEFKDMRVVQLVLKLIKLSLT